MFHNKIKQEVFLKHADEKYVVHFGVQDSLVAHLFGRGVIARFSAYTKLELHERIDSVIEELENKVVEPEYGILLVYPHSLSGTNKGIRKIPVFEHQKEEVIKDLKNIKNLI